jgi:hypothetical protein
MALGLGVLGGALLLGVRWGTQQTDLSNTIRGALVAGTGAAVAVGAGMMGHPEAAAALAAAGVGLGGAIVIDDKTPAKKATTTKQLRGLGDLTDDEAEALGAIAAELGDFDDDDLGEVAAELGDFDDDDLGDADDDFELGDPEDSELMG